MMTSISKNIFNLDFVKTTNNQSLFLQERYGLVDTIHKKHPTIWKLYKDMKRLDWDENEFDFSSCLMDFQKCPPHISDAMIKTLAWQWEADSIASHSLTSIIAPFVSSDELWAAWSEVGRNEIVHANTYSEIVRNSFEDPSGIIDSILAETEALKRLTAVSEVFAKTYNVSHKLALGMIDRDSDEAYDAILLFTVALLALERIQFVGSFAITFHIVDNSWFLPIGKAVQKINVDEFMVHVKLDKAIIANELSLAKGQASFARILPSVNKVLSSVIESEMNWTKYLFKDHPEIFDLTEKRVLDWLYFNATDVYDFLNGCLNTGLKIENPYKRITKNPLPYMNEWIDINNNQASAQEERVANYLLGGVKNTTDGKKYEIDF